MGKYVFWAALVATAAPAHASSAPFDPSPLLDRAIAKLKGDAYRSQHVDWPALEGKAYAAAEGAQDEIDLLKSLQILLDGLEDGHSFIQTSSEYREAFKKRYERNYWENGKPQKVFRSKFSDRKEPEARSLRLPASQATLITVPKMMGGGEAAQLYAEKLFDLVDETSSRSCGYVLDLRGNTGGNIWPMVLGLNGLIGDDAAGRQISADGRRSAYAELRQGRAIIEKSQEGGGDEIVHISNWRSLPKLETLPVAVLIDDVVGSSGEGTVIQLKGRAHTRFFGEKTAGVASSNSGWTLTDDINLVITTAMMMDRNGNIYPEGIVPDYPVPAGEGSPDDPDDAVVEAAKLWLSSQDGCSK